MDYKIIGETVPVVEMKLRVGETVYTQSGGMAYQSDGISMATNARGGIMKSLGRMFTGESIFMANYTAQKDGAMVAFASTVPGGIIDLDLATLPGGMMIQKGAFLCAESNVETSVAFTKKFSAGLFGGEGFVLQKATGNVVAFEPSVSYGIETISGLGNIFLGGEGLFLTKLVGPGKVILQSQNFKDFAGRLIPYMPRTTNNN